MIRIYYIFLICVKSKNTQTCIFSNRWSNKYSTNLLSFNDCASTINYFVVFETITIWLNHQQPNNIWAFIWPIKEFEVHILWARVFAAAHSHIYKDHSLSFISHFSYVFLFGFAFSDQLVCLMFYPYGVKERGLHF